MRKLTTKQLEELKKKLIALDNACRAIKKDFEKRGIIDEDGNASDELSEDAKTAVDMVTGAGEFDYLYQYADELAK